MDYEKENLQWLEFDLLAEHTHITGVTFLRHGGVSKGHFSTLNLSDYVGDDPTLVKINKETVRKAIDVPLIIYPKQVHGVNVALITNSNKDKHYEVDALITKEKKIGLAVLHADCQGAIFYDLENNAVGVAHAGYKGLCQNIYATVLQAMKGAFGTRASHTVVCISPSLGPDHAEYKNYKTEFPKELWGFQEKENHFNFWDIAKMQLMDAGVLDKHIEIVETCTYCNEKDYFSHRKSKDTGRCATVVAINS